MKKQSVVRRAALLIMTVLMVVSLAGCSSKTSDTVSTVTVEATESANYPDVSISTNAPTAETVETSASPSPDAKVASSLVEQGEINDAEDIALPVSGIDETEEVDEEEEIPSLTPTQLNTVNMLNYMTALTQNVTEERKNQLFLETAYNSFDNLYPNSVDAKTQAQITSLMDTINDYRMISVKRQRLEFIYEQNRAQALRKAIPNPMGLLSVVQSGSLLKAAASVLYMAVDSVTSYQAATNQADLQFIKDGWELDDAESAALHTSTKNALTYMFEMVRAYDIPGDYALSRTSVENFITWSSKPDSQLVSKIAWFEAHQSTYEKFGPYWLALVRCYYNAGDYEKCLNAINEYESITTRIFRQNLDFADVLPMVIISAKETMDTPEYIKIAEKYCPLILSNSKDSNWSIRYFTAQIYLDLYALTNSATYLDEAYEIAFNNVNELVGAQRETNTAYLAPVQEAKADKDATKREKDEVNQYNKIIKEERKTALPPVNEALYLNCDLLFALAEQRNVPETEKARIEAILHENGDNIFLTDALDERFWFTSKHEIDEDTINIEYDGKKLVIPATCVTERSVVTVTIFDNSGKTVLDDWKVTGVKRPNNGGFSEFEATYESEKGKAYKYLAGGLVTIKVVPVAEASDEYLEFEFNVIAIKNLYVFDGIKFERKAN